MKRGVRLTRRPLRVDLNDDPFALLVNFFDCSVVFALGFIVALLAKPATPAPPATGADASRAEVERVAADHRIEHLRPTADTASGEGVRLGTAYRLANGDVVYVPENTPPR